MRIYFVEFFNCKCLQDRILYSSELKKAGATITDEKINFDKNIVKFYFTINYVDGKEFKDFFSKLKKSKVWSECAWNTEG